MILGIDPSFTGTGIIILSDAGELRMEKLVKTSSKDHITVRVKEIIREIEKAIELHGVLDIISIEGFSYGSVQHAHQMGYLGYRIREYLMQAWKGVPIIEPSPGQVKKFATGKGNAEKDTIIKEVYKRWGYDTNNNNLADAFVIAQIGRAYLQDNYKPDDLSLFQFEVIAALKGEKKTGKKGK